jgi:hypothetical protein
VKAAAEQEENTGPGGLGALAAQRSEHLSTTAQGVARTARYASVDARAKRLAKVDRATRRKAAALAQERLRLASAKPRRAATNREANQTSGTPTESSAASSYWSANWDKGPCTDASCHKEWSFVQAEDPAQAYPELNKVPMASDLDITAHSGCCVAKFEVTQAALSANRMHSKVFKEFQIPGASIKRDQFGRSLEELPASGIDGTYRAWYYVPQDYKVVTSDWSNIFQFKLTEENPFKQNPQWWVNLVGGPNGQPYLHVENLGNGTFSDPNGRKPMPKGKWFEIRADLHEGNKIDWYLDGQYWETVTDGNGSIGRGAATSTPRTWVFGVGHYGGVGRLYVDDVSFTPFGH